MAETKLDIELWQIARVKPYKNNAKLHPPEQVERLAKLIAKHGFDQPIVVDKRGVIIKGHGRLLAAQKLGMPTVPTIVSNMSAAAAAEARIADNRVTEYGWDFDALQLELTNFSTMKGFDPILTGFSLADVSIGAIAEEQDDGSGGVKADEAWAGMPEFKQEDLTAFKAVLVNFKTQADVDAFAKLVKQTVTPQTRSLWYPYEAPAVGMTTEKRYDAKP